MTSQTYTLEELTRTLGATLHGDGAQRVSGLATLSDAGPDDIAFLANRAYQRFLGETRAAAVLLPPDLVSECPVAALALDNPYLGYAHLSHLFAPPLAGHRPGVHASACVAESAVLGKDVSIGPNVVIGEHAVIGERTVIGAGCSVGEACSIGSDSLLHANVTLYHGVIVGQRAIIHSGAVVGGDGFGFAHDGSAWHKIAQIGGVVVGDDVEIGSCSSIDRGALGDTVIGDGVKIDSQVQIAHNVHIGEHCALAGCVGIAGSTRVGRHCQLGGGVGLAGHLELCDGVQITGMSLVTNSIHEPGVYSSGTGSMPNDLWRRNAVRFKQLDQMARRLTRLERDRDRGTSQ